MEIVKKYLGSSDGYRADPTITYNSTSNEILIAKHTYTIRNISLTMDADSFIPEDGDELILTEKDGYVVRKRNFVFDVRTYGGWAYTIGFVNGTTFTQLCHIEESK